MKNILITGGAGFIGSNLALRLISMGWDVTVLDNLSPQIHGENGEESALYRSVRGKVRFIKGDVTNREDVVHAMKGQNAVIHLAAETGTGQSMYSIEKYNRINVGGTAVLLDVLVNTVHSVRKIILASSRAVYGEGKYADGEQIIFPPARSARRMDQGFFEMTAENDRILRPLPTDEHAVLHPSSYYGLTKLQQEQMTQLVCRSVGVSYVILRYQNVYGRGQSLLNPYTGILSIFSTQILDGKELNIFEDGKMTRDFVNIEDAVTATVTALESQQADNQVLNVGTGIPVDVLTVAHQLIRAYGKEVPVRISGDFRVGDIRHNFADLSKISDILGFEPKVSFNQGIRDFAEWVLQQPRVKNRLEDSLREMKDKGFFKS